MVAMVPALKIMSIPRCNAILVVKPNCHVMPNASLIVSVSASVRAKVYNLMNFNVKCLIKLHKSTCLLLLLYTKAFHNKFKAGWEEYLCCIYVYTRIIRKLV